MESLLFHGISISDEAYRELGHSLLFRSHCQKRALLASTNLISDSDHNVSVARSYQSVYLQAQIFVSLSPKPDPLASAPLWWDLPSVYALWSHQPPRTGKKPSSNLANRTYAEQNPEPFGEECFCSYLGPESYPHLSHSFYMRRNKQDPFLLLLFLSPERITRQMYGLRQWSQSLVSLFIPNSGLPISTKP